MILADGRLPSASGVLIRHVRPAPVIYSQPLSPLLLSTSPLPTTNSLLYRVRPTVIQSAARGCEHIRSIMKGILALSLLPLLASASPVLVDTIHNEAAPILSSTLAQEIPDSYIVVFKKDVSHASACAHHDWVQEQHVQIETAMMDLAKRSQFPLIPFRGLKHTFNFAGSLLGYSGHFDASLIEQVRRHPDVSPRATSLISLSTYLFFPRDHTETWS